MNDTEYNFNYTTPATNRTVEIYLDDGRITYYQDDSEEKAREHIGLIIKSGFRA